MKSRYLAAFLAAMLGFVAVVSAQASPLPASKGAVTVAAPSGADTPAARVGRYGKIVDAKPVGLGGLVAWTVEATNGQTVVLYTTPDASVVFTGILWDAKTGKNISDQFLPRPSTSAMTPAVAAAAATPNEHKASALEGKYTGAIPEAIKTVASLDGIQEGKGNASNTVYIIFDPRCHYCHAAYALTRKYVKDGFAIKWIPSLALGDPSSGAPVVASIMQSKRPVQELARVMTSASPLGNDAKPTKTTMELLAKNLSFLFAAFENSHSSGPAGVPVAFYIDHRTGKPTMMTGVSSQVVLDDIFGKSRG